MLSTSSVRTAIRSRKQLRRSIWALLLLPISSSWGQSASIDSLRAVVQQYQFTGTLNDSTGLLALSEITKEALNLGAMDTALAYAARSISLLERIGGPDSMHPFTLKHSGLAYRRLATAQQAFDDYPAALKSLQRYEHFAQELKFDKGVGKCYVMMAACFRELQDTARALAFSHKAITVLEGIDPSMELAEAYMGLGGIHNNLFATDSSTYWLNKAATIFQELKNTSKEGAVYLNLVELHVNAGRVDQAAINMDKARIVEEIWKGKPAMAAYLGLKAKVLLLQGKFDEADEAVRRAIQFAREAPSDLYQLYHIRALASAGKQHGDSAYAFLLKGNNYFLEDQDADKVRALTEAQLTMEHGNEMRLADAELKLEQDQKRFAMLGIALISAIAILLFTLVVRTRRAALLLRSKNEELTRTQSQLITAEKLREAEQVRTRIARDIHDELGGDLTKISLMTSDLASRIANEQGALKGTVKDLGRVAREANAALKDIVWSVDPSQDTWQGLVDHTEAYTKRMLEGTSLKSELQFIFNGPDLALDPATKQHIFLVLKEALNNVLKHAQATMVHVRLSTSANGYTLFISDNGSTGGRSEGSNGSGLKNMRKRAELLAATLELSITGHGSTVEMSGPIEVS